MASDKSVQRPAVIRCAGEKEVKLGYAEYNTEQTCQCFWKSQFPRDRIVARGFAIVGEILWIYAAPPTVERYLSPQEEREREASVQHENVKFVKSHLEVDT